MDPQAASGPLACDLCGLTFAGTLAMALHLQEHARKRYLNSHLSFNDKKFLRALRIQPWEDDAPDTAASSRAPEAEDTP